MLTEVWGKTKHKNNPPPKKNKKQTAPQMWAASLWGRVCGLNKKKKESWISWTPTFTFLHFLSADAVELAVTMTSPPEWTRTTNQNKLFLSFLSVRYLVPVVRKLTNTLGLEETRVRSSGTMLAWGRVWRALFCKRPSSKSLRLCWPHSLCHYKTLWATDHLKCEWIAVTAPHYWEEGSES